jgi:iron complex transport system substrate-binding protein
MNRPDDQPADLDPDIITGIAIDVAIKIHRDLGPGLLESVYEILMCRELSRRGLRVERQKAIRIDYDGASFDDAFRADLFIEGAVIIEIKSLERLAPIHTKQLLTYLRLANLTVGLLLNFGAATLKDGLKRVVNDYPRSASSMLRVNTEDTDNMTL